MSDQTTISIGVIDDHQLFRKGLIELIQNVKGLDVTLEAGDGEDLLQQLLEVMPDVLLLDLKMPKLDGIDAMKIIRKKYPRLKIIVLSMFDDDRFILHAYQVGANGYLLKNAPPEEVVKAIRDVADDGYYVSPAMSSILARGVANKSYKPALEETHLTNREIEVLELLCEGKTTEEISNELFLSARTVEGHRRNLMEKTESKNATALVAWAFKNKIVS